jgi:peptidyl-prolyl cis-trans isomerase B (cyclophilin B)
MTGLDVVAAVASVPTYKPNKNIKQFNNFASFLGDERAANARNFWDRPLKTVVISGCGEIPLGLPVFPPGLP